jgi:starch synthase (maltosyl-transferring)
MAPKIYHLHPLVAGPLADWSRHLARCRAMGFNYVASAPLFRPGRHGDIFLTGDHETLHPALGSVASADPAIAWLVNECGRHNLGLILDLVVDRVAADAVLRKQEPNWFEETPDDNADSPDPRRAPHDSSRALARFDQPDIAERLAHWWIRRLVRLAHVGVSGFRCLGPDRIPASAWKQIVSGVRTEAPQCRFLAWTPGIARDAVGQLSGIGFDHVGSSHAWWNARASWLVEEAEALRQVAPVVASPEPSFTERLAPQLDPQVDLLVGYRRALHLAAMTASGMFIPMGFEFATRRPFDIMRGAPADFERIRQEAICDLSDEVKYANRLVDRIGELPVDGEVRALTGPGSRVTALLRSDTADVRTAKRALVVMVNPDLSRPTPCFRLDPLPPEAGAAFGSPQAVNGQLDPESELAPGEVRAFRFDRAHDIIRMTEGDRSVSQAALMPRVMIEAITPAVDQAAFPVKRLLGENIAVRATIFGDGHDALAAELLWRSVNAGEWQRVQMQPLGNDRWEAEFAPRRVGRHVFTIEAWRDEWGTFRRDLKRKHDADLDIILEIEEGCMRLRQVAERAAGDAQTVLETILQTLTAIRVSDRLDILLSDDLRASVASANERPSLVRHAPDISLDADRPQAAFASWYELFPRSLTTDPARHGTFADLIGRLPAIRAMGFDVLYLPPIHPIGTTNRKGQNNSLLAGPRDIGSPYAIGSADGGHDAIHPMLGTLDDFQRLVAAAGEHGLEIALDYAIQCSPDHPWLQQHPEWFRRRADGTVQYAENPPKKYEDIVNVDFYAETAIPELWTALRDVVQFWIDQGVRTFRVDNPHTKPLPFWEWLISDIHASAPGVIFLAEAFTRPAMMYHLAKVGFTQSYTYFTWRNTKREIVEYLTELSSKPVSEYFRPNFFVNTPDINPLFLQTSGRAGFLIRAGLAATLSGLWGMYSGFELCEAAPLPGREEYLNSEKYEIRPRDYAAPGNIVREITALNRLRRAHPALHSHLGVQFYDAYSDDVLLYGKRGPGQSDMILVAISLDPLGVQDVDIDIPLWEWNLPDHGSLAVEDLLYEQRFVWTGKRQHVRLDPAVLPYAIWRIAPFGGA